LYICNALVHHGHSAFSLTILEYIDIANLSKEEARKLILEREQYYLDLFFNKEEPLYNILKIVGSSLGYKHSAETLLKMSEAKKGVKNPMFGKTGENSPIFGRSYTAETLAKPLRGLVKPIKVN